MILAYLERTSGYSRAQLKRLVARWHTSLATRMLDMSKRLAVI